MSTIPAIERRRRQQSARVAGLKRFAVPLILLAITAGLTLAVGFYADGGGFPGHAFGRGEQPLSRLAGFAVSAFAGGWIVFLLIRLLRLLLRPVHPIISIARLTVDEALRSYVVVIFTTIMLALLCGLPLILSATQPLRYQIQSYLTYSHVVASAMLGLITVLFACWNVAKDMEQQRAFDVFSKPVSRGGYLLGKFVGVALLNLVLVTVAVSVMWYIPRVMYGSEASVNTRTIRDGRIDPYDQVSVNSQVLTARGVTDAVPFTDFEAATREQMTAYQQNDPEGFADFVEAAGGMEAAFIQAFNEVRNDWLQIPPLESRTYRFVGLERLKRIADDAMARDEEPLVLQLRYHVEIPALERSDRVYMMLTINQIPNEVTALVDQKQVYNIPANLIADDGTLDVSFANYTFTADGQPAIGTGDRPRTVKFAPEEGLQVLYEVGDFGPNVIRAGAVLWLRLAFLAALGTVCGAVFSFAVAAILALAISVLAAGGESIARVVASGSADTGVSAVDAAYTGLLGFTSAIASVLRTFSSLDVTGNLADGQVIRFAELGETVLWVSLGWTGITLLIGWYLFSRREIARVQV